jgi:hypothetical protein
VQWVDSATAKDQIAMVDMEADYEVFTMRWNDE